MLEYPSAGRDMPVGIAVIQQTPAIGDREEK
jgi:hypothetical protein